MIILGEIFIYYRKRQFLSSIQTSLKELVCLIM